MGLYEWMGLVPIEDYKELEARYNSLAQDYRMLQEKHRLLMEEYIKLEDAKPKRGKGGRFEKR